MRGTAAAVLVVAMVVGAEAAGWSLFGSKGSQIPEPEYHVLSKKFRGYHMDQANIFAHMITTPLSVLAVVAMVNKAMSVAFITQIATAVYCVSLHDKLPGHLLALTGLVVRLPPPTFGKPAVRFGLLPPNQDDSCFVLGARLPFADERLNRQT